ncbi:MAG: branched-chain amino acid ABC transporter permease [Rhodobacteraceae bacterium MED-G08]|nr:branched-chain amino acid ABC transporter permease [Marinovum sp.]OUU11297.1 MAG: branched-chain amino acid ABC transporter permease [Rhodobacteraceae bacterium TMED38]PDH58554.1 MAG: branched-chain amino acid ABC transporter permease [Rhodobacteraceae bacterium MED-G08]
MKTYLLFAAVFLLIVITGFIQSWNSALFILNMGLISAVMSLGVNLQWGIAGLLNVGIMGFVGLGGLATVLISMQPVPEAWNAGGPRILAGLLFGVLTITLSVWVYKKIKNTRWRFISILIFLVCSFFVYKSILTPGVVAVEAVNPAATGYLGGLGLPVLLAWPVGGLMAAGAAWIIGKTALGLRSDYLAIATLGISEIIIAILRNEDWMTRGVKNVAGIPRPVPYEIDLQASENFVNRAASFGLDPTTASTLFVKIAYAGLFGLVLFVLVWLSQRALNSPWGRMMRAIRDNETAAQAMGKDIKSRHLQIFILGSAVCGIAGAMMTTLDAQLTPGAYQPLRFTFLIWVMVIVGGSGSNLGSILGGFLVWFLWVQVEPIGYWLVDLITAPMDPESPVRLHLLDSVAQMRLLTMGLFLLLMLRFYPRGMIPEK